MVGEVVSDYLCFLNVVTGLGRCELVTLDFRIRIK